MAKLAIIFQTAKFLPRILSFLAMVKVVKAAIKRGQSHACMSYAEREQDRQNVGHFGHGHFGHFHFRIRSFAHYIINIYIYYIVSDFDKWKTILTK